MSKRVKTCIGCSDNKLVETTRSALAVNVTRKPCCRKETARCRKCSFPLKLANNSHYKYKTSQASKAATLQSSKHAGAKRNLTQNQDSKSIKVTCLESVEKHLVRHLSNHNVGFSCQGFDFRRHRPSIYKKDLHIFPWISNTQRITVLYSASR